MKAKLLLFFIFLLVFVFGAQAGSQAALTYELDTQGTTNTVVVKGVPFYTDLKMSVTSDNPNNNVRDLLLHTKGREFGAGEPVFLGATRGPWLPQAGNPDQNKLLSDNVWQYMFTGAHGTVDTAKATEKVVVKLQVRATTPGQITLDDTKSNVVGGNIEPFALEPVVPYDVDPQPSRCGDGVVGYFDDGAGDNTKTNNGIRDEGEQLEACDVPSPEGSQERGCVECRYVNLGYEETNCGFGSRGCQVNEMNPKDLLIAKLTALIKGDCYPSPTMRPTFPDEQRLYCQDKLVYDLNGKLNLRNKVKLISGTSAALVKFFEKAYLPP